MVATCTIAMNCHISFRIWISQDGMNLFLGVFLVPQFHGKTNTCIDPIRHDETTIDWSGESCVSLVWGSLWSNEM